jgi:uncharacterized damage-inducible protein DinB
MGEVARIHDQLVRAFHGEAWHGAAVRELVSGVNAEQAARKVLPHAHTIWEIVLHISAWQRAVLGRLQGREMQLTPEQDWPRVADTGERAWKGALAELEETHRQLADAVAALDEAALERVVPGKSYSVYYMLHGVIQHDLYHAGQIAVLRKEVLS